MRVAILTAAFVLSSLLFAPNEVSSQEKQGKDSGVLAQLTDAQELLEQTINQQRQQSTSMTALLKGPFQAPLAEHLAVARKKIEAINGARQPIVEAVNRLQAQLRALRENPNPPAPARCAFAAPLAAFTNGIQMAQIQARSNYAEQMLKAALNNLSDDNADAAWKRFNDGLQQEQQIQRTLEDALPRLADAIKATKENPQYALITRDTPTSSPTRMGAIAGQLRTKSGDLAPNMRVVALTAGDDVAAIVSLAATDQNGRYELKDIPAGCYLVAAGPLATASYFPGVAVISEATTVPVTSGVTATNIDFSLQ